MSINDLHGLVIVHTIERHATRKSNDISPIFDVLEIKRVECFSAPMPADKAKEYLNERLQEEDRVVSYNFYRLETLDGL